MTAQPIIRVYCLINLQRKIKELRLYTRKTVVFRRQETQDLTTLQVTLLLGVMPMIMLMLIGLRINMTHMSNQEKMLILS